MPGGLYEAGNVSYGIPYSGPVSTALSTPCPPPTPSPHLVSLGALASAASLPTPYFTLRVTLPCLCPSVPVQRHEYEYEYEQDPAHLHGSAYTSTSINKPTALPSRTAYEYRSLLYCTGPAPLAALQRCLF